MLQDATARLAWFGTLTCTTPHPTIGDAVAGYQILPACWSVRARTRRFEFSRATKVVGRHGGVTELALHASPQDAAVAILLTVNDDWSGAALWARTGVVLDGVVLDGV